MILDALVLTVKQSPILLLGFVGGVMWAHPARLLRAHPARLLRANPARLALVAPFRLAKMALPVCAETIALHVVGLELCC